MIIVFNCPGCGAILRMKEQYGGQRGRCPHCQGAITVPAIETDAGMDLLPLEGGPGGPSAGNGPATPPQMPPSAFSLASRFPAAAQPSGASEGAPSQPISASSHSPTGGDSNIGLAPLEERATKPSAPVASPLAQSATSSPAPQSSAGDRHLAWRRLMKLPRSRACRPPAPRRRPPRVPPRHDHWPEIVTLAWRPWKPARWNTKRPSPPRLPPNPRRLSSRPPRPKRPMTCSASCVRSAGQKCAVPPAAAGKQVSCPKCKNKLRVPEQPPTVAATETKKSSSNGDTISLAEPAATGSDLSAGMLDMLDEGASSAGAGEAAQAAPLSSPKLSGGRSKSGTILGLPPVAVYGGAGAITLLLVSLIVYIVIGPGSKTPSSVAQGSVGGAARNTWASNTSGDADSRGIGPGSARPRVDSCLIAAAGNWRPWPPAAANGCHASGTRGNVADEY